MQQQWWQRKLFFGLGIVGAITFVLESVIGSLMWPAYQSLAHPIALLTAQGAPFRGGFLVMQVLASLAVTVALVAIYAYHRYQRERKMMQASAGMIFSWSAWLIVTNFWPNARMADYVLAESISGKSIVLALILLALAGMMYWYAQAVMTIDWISLRNVLTVVSILIVLFAALEFGMYLINWPLRGFFDILTLDTMALGMGFLSWYFMRQAI